MDWMVGQPSPGLTGSGPPERIGSAARAPCFGRPGLGLEMGLR